MKRLAIAALLGCVVQFATAHAQESSGPSSAPVPAPSEGGRYTYHRVQDTVVRLDTQTGRVATCESGPAGWICRMAPEDRAALEAEIGRLQTENAALKNELLSRGLGLPGAARPDPMPPVAEAPPRPPQPVPAPRSPMENEMDRVRTFIGDVWRRLVEMVVEMQRDIQRKS